MAGPLLVVNLRGMVNTRHEVRTTLKLLRVENRYTAALIPGREDVLPVLRRAKDHIAWAPATKELILDLLVKRGRGSSRRKLTLDDVKKAGYSGYEELAQALAEGRVESHHLGFMKSFFRLSPPRGGLGRSSRRTFQEKGILGENPDLPSLVRRMV